ncbi:hypothetical protein [Oribacterium sp. WCC10]|uniref:hypothetical protein n=1 Tax=Oribacterium sp. WCC10 TaxID=1855343 RepID=UPI0008ED22F3|nr:hypothetical protein [Oribacterium sp. WCC10]SFG59378.1 hypothetical protein SAMN05216356_11438 [Oribacterium sp. WCC10]
MRIKSKYDLLKRVSNAIAALSKDERYPESLASLKGAATGNVRSLYKVGDF